MEELTYTDSEYRENEDGFLEKYVYVPQLDEWMTEDEFAFNKACYDPAFEDARVYEREHGSDDEDCYYDETDDDDLREEDDDDNDGPDYSSMSREEAMAEYERTGINHTEHDLNDWDDINRRLGFEFFNPKK